MPSPYPGVDPEIEKQTDWQGFHAPFNANLQAWLVPWLGENYDATIEQRVILSEPEEKPEEKEGYEARGDVAVISLPPLTFSSEQSGNVAVLEPDQETARARMVKPEYLKQRYIGIRSPINGDIVTIIELLSPSNKRGDGYDRFERRHHNLLEKGVSLVEIDLLRQGRRMPAAKAAPGHDGYAFVTYAEDPTETHVWAFDIKDRLPRVMVPLNPEDESITLDLGAVYTETYDRGGFARRLKYDAALPKAADVPAT
jgi:hypothetical protein